MGGSLALASHAHNGSIGVRGAQLEGGREGLSTTWACPTGHGTHGRRASPPAPSCARCPRNAPSAAPSGAPRVARARAAALDDAVLLEQCESILGRPAAQHARRVHDDLVGIGRPARAAGRAPRPGEVAGPPRARARRDRARALLDRDQRIVLGVRILRQHADPCRAIGKLADDALEPRTHDADDAQVVAVVRQPLDLVEARQAADRMELGAPLDSRAPQPGSSSASAMYRSRDERVAHHRAVAQLEDVERHGRVREQHQLRAAGTPAPDAWAHRARTSPDRAALPLRGGCRPAEPLCRGRSTRPRRFELGQSSPTNSSSSWMWPSTFTFG
mgnify:CR=1 FL=1